MSNEPIPFLDLVTPHRELEEELVEVFRQALHSAAFVGGAQVEGFEREFAEFCGTRYCVGVANGTDAVRFALMASGVGPGDAVVTVPNTFIATVEAISQAGAGTEFVDIDERTYCMSPDALETYLKGCANDAATGRPLGQADRQADQGRPAGAPVRPGRRHGRHPVDRGAVQAARDRGCLPGARGGVPLGQRRLAAGGIVRQGGRVQFLSGQEPRARAARGAR